MRVLKARFVDTAAFREAYDEALPCGGLFCPTTQALDEGEEVVVEIHFPELPNKMHLRGAVVSWRAATPRLGIRAGATIAFAEDEQDKCRFILEVADGRHRNAVKRRHARLPVERPARWRLASATDLQEAALREISIGGAHLVTPEQLELGEDIVVELTMPGGAQPISLVTKVAYRTPSGYGLRFVYRDGGGSRRLREMVRRLVNAD